MQTTIIIKGTHCASCKTLIEDVCKDIPGINACTVDFGSGTTVIEHEENLDWQKVKTEIEGLGAYRVEFPNTSV